MKISIFGYDQRVADSMGLEVDHLLILRWLTDAKHGNRWNKSIQANGKVYYLVKARDAIDDLPCLGLSSRRSIQKRLQYIAEVGVLDVHKTEGSHNYVRFTEKYQELLI